MKLEGIGLMALGVLMVVSCGEGVDESGDPKIASIREPIVGPSTLSGRNEVVMLFARTLSGTRTCSGGYFAPRVVATAAHCLTDIVNGQLLVYYGDTYDADFALLTEDQNGFVIPAPGRPSVWSKADSFEIHPAYVPDQHFPDLGIIYLDRKLPFDPLPLSRSVVAANRVVTISGWGANSTPTPTTGVGGHVQRTGTSRTLGSPTLADFHPEDPNNGLLVAANRAAQIKLDGSAPDANTCFGDSGSPLLVTDSGQLYIAGVNYFTGLSCADYSLYTRISSFLPFFDQAYKKGGQEVLTPTFDCVAPNAQGTLSAFFGYDNKNGVSVTVPFGTKNSIARDPLNQRPSRFLPGTHPFSVGADFASSQTVTWTLSPDNSPTTTLTVNQTSRRCGAAEADQTECALSCRASQRSGCPTLPTFEGCLGFCLAQIGFIRDQAPGCLAANTAIDVCTATVSSNPASWLCDDTFGAFAVDPCAAQFAALDTCFSQGF